MTRQAIDPQNRKVITMSPHANHDERHVAGGAAPGGLAVSQNGYTFEPERTFFEPGTAARFSFRISDPDGRVLNNEFEVDHERELHLIVVRRDTSIYQHVHPDRGVDGTWSIALSLPEGGIYRAYADFRTGGRSRTLSADLFVPGGFGPTPLPEPRTTAEADGYAVELRADGSRAGTDGGLASSVTRDGTPVENLEDYLGTKGHLVALREGDLAYLHVHPAGHRHAGVPAAGDAHLAETHSGSNEVAFAVTFPSAGRYRLFLQFQTAGVVRTVAFTVEVSR